MMNTSFVRLNFNFFDLKLEDLTNKHVRKLLNVIEPRVRCVHASKSNIYVAVNPETKRFILSEISNTDCSADVAEIIDGFRYAAIEGLGRNVQSFALSICAALAVAEQNSEVILDSGLGLGESVSIEEVYQKYSVLEASNSFELQAIRAFSEVYGA